MGIYMNSNVHQGVFLNRNIKESNQDYFKLDYHSELIKNQIKANDSLLKSFHQLRSIQEKIESAQASQLQEINGQLEQLKQKTTEHETFEQQVLTWLAELGRNQEQLKENSGNEESKQQKLMEEIHMLQASNQEILSQLEKYASENEQITRQMSASQDQQTQMNSRLEKQEALAEKIVHQLNHLRAIIFERTTDLAEKIEQSYQKTSSYVSDLLTGSNLFVLKSKKEENHKRLK